MCFGGAWVFEMCAHKSLLTVLAIDGQTQNHKDSQYQCSVHRLVFLNVILGQFWKRLGFAARALRMPAPPYPATHPMGASKTEEPQASGEAKLRQRSLVRVSTGWYSKAVPTGLQLPAGEQ